MMNTFVIYGQDNESYAFREYLPTQKQLQIHQSLVPDMTGSRRPGLRRCEICGELTAKWEEPLSSLFIKKRKYDMSITYDGVVVASQRFKSAYDESCLMGLMFCRLPSDPEFYAIQASKVIQFDAKRRNTRFVKQCPSCGHFESVVGATPAFFIPGTEVLGSEFARTDLEFGSGDEKHPLLICGNVVANTISDANLKGMDLIPVRDDENCETIEAQN